MWKKSIEHTCKAIRVMEPETNMTLYEAIHLAGILDSFDAILSSRFERTGSMDDLSMQRCMKGLSYGGYGKVWLYVWGLDLIRHSVGLSVVWE